MRRKRRRMRRKRGRKGGGGKRTEEEEDKEALVYLVGLHKADKHREENRGRGCLGILPKILHSIIKGILQQAQLQCPAHPPRPPPHRRHSMETQPIPGCHPPHCKSREHGSTWAILASSWSFLSLPSLLWMKSLSMVLWSCMVYSRLVSSRPRCSSFTSSRTFSRDTAKGNRNAQPTV